MGQEDLSQERSHSGGRRQFPYDAASLIAAALILPVFLQSSHVTRRFMANKLNGVNQQCNKEYNILLYRLFSVE